VSSLAWSSLARSPFDRPSFARSLFARSFARLHSWLRRARRPALLTLTALVAAAAAPRGAAAQDLAVAAASDLQAALPVVTAQFEKATGHHVNVTFGSSGSFVTQIQNGAPFDLFFSADIDYAKRLESAALTEPGSFYGYAVGHIVVWTRKDSGIDVTRGLKVLQDPAVRKISIANPEHAPYGRAAVAALKHEGLHDAVQPKIVLGENISQAAQFVQSGNADVGIIALSLALAPKAKEAGVYAEVPAGSYPPIEQAAVILKASKNKTVARDFLAFLQRPEIVRIMQSFGFEMPGK
jgi:molybdate transport system substrate-binding protein